MPKSIRKKSIRKKSILKKLDKYKSSKEKTDAAFDEENLVIPIDNDEKNLGETE